MILMPKSVLVTGAAGGIGRALVEHLSSAGWAVLGTDISDHSLTSIDRERLHGWITADLTTISHDIDYLNSFVGSVLELSKDFNFSAIIHNAAFQIVAPFSRLSTQDWLETLEINLLAPVVISRALLPQLSIHSGSIVHVGSIHSNLTKSGFTAYATSKAAIGGLTRSMAVELGGSVRVNAIEPAAIATPMLEAGFAHDPELKAKLESFHPTCSIGNPADVARAALFLLDPANTFINGCVLPLGGGIHSRLHDPA